MPEHVVFRNVTLVCGLSQQFHVVHNLSGCSSRHQYQLSVEPEIEQQIMLAEHSAGNVGILTVLPYRGEANKRQRHILR
jgi:hypothetical protein